MPTVLITDPQQRAALAAARALARSGHTVHTIGARKGIAGVSRSVRRHHVIQVDDERSAEAFVSRVAAVAKEHAIDVVLPITDFSSTALLGAEATIGARIAGPSREAYLRASDKQHAALLATQVGIAVPVQRVAEDPEHAMSLGAALRMPVVLKPSRSVVQRGETIVRLAVQYVDSHTAYQHTIASLPAEAYPLLLQERTFGRGVGVFLLRQNGRTLLSFAHRRLREKPPSGGVSTYRESIEPPPLLLSRCEALLDALAYEGAAMIEFKEDQQTSAHVLMEINARLWGSLQLAIDAGLDFPTALVALTLNLPLSPTGAIRLGVRSTWELGELDHMLALLLKSREVLQLPNDYPIGVGAAWRAMWDRKLSDRLEVFRLNDPRPLLAELLAWFERR